MDIQTGFFAGKGILILTLPTADPPGSFDCVAGKKLYFSEIHLSSRLVEQ